MNPMSLLEIRSHIVSNESFKEYLEGRDGDEGATLDLIIQAIEIDGASLADFEVLELIAEIIYMWQDHQRAKDLAEFKLNRSTLTAEEQARFKELTEKMEEN